MNDFQENHKSFFDQLVFLSFDDKLDIELAYALNKYWFRAKYRMEFDDDYNEIRYFEHLRRVALILIDELKIADSKMIIACLCHDALEDTRNDDLAASQIEKRFGDVIQMVKLLSKCPKEGYSERLLSFADWRVLLLKACDRLDNLRTLKFGSLKFQAKQIEETRVKYYPLFDKMINITPAEHKEKAIYLRTTIYNFVENFVVQEPQKFLSNDRKDPEKIKKIFEHLKEYGEVKYIDESGKEVGRASTGAARLKIPIGDE